MGVHLFKGNAQLFCDLCSQSPFTNYQLETGTETCFAGTLETRMTVWLKGLSHVCRIAFNKALQSQADQQPSQILAARLLALSLPRIGLCQPKGRMQNEFAQPQYNGKILSLTNLVNSVALLRLLQHALPMPFHREAACHGEVSAQGRFALGSVGVLSQ